MGDLMAHISRLSGFPDKMKMYGIRRGADFILEIYCPQVVKRLIGHKHDSTSISEYISEISTTDVQALSRGIAVSNITQMSNIRLGRVADAPTGPSETAFQAPSK